MRGIVLSVLLVLSGQALSASVTYAYISDELQVPIVPHPEDTHLPQLSGERYVGYITFDLDLLPNGSSNNLDISFDFPGIGLPQPSTPVLDFNFNTTVPSAGFPSGWNSGSTFSSGGFFKTDDFGSVTDYNIDFATGPFIEVVLDPTKAWLFNNDFIAFNNTGGTWTKVGSSMSAVPLPAGVWLFITGLLALGSFARRRASRH